VRTLFVDSLSRRQRILAPVFASNQKVTARSARPWKFIRSECDTVCHIFLWRCYFHTLQLRLTIGCGKWYQFNIFMRGKECKLMLPMFILRWRNDQFYLHFKVEKWSGLPSLVVSIASRAGQRQARCSCRFCILSEPRSSQFLFGHVFAKNVFPFYFHSGLFYQPGFERFIMMMIPKFE